MFGAKEDQLIRCDTCRNCISLGGLPEKRRPLSQRDAGQHRRCRRLQAERPGVPVDGFWSITRLQREGYLEPNQYMPIPVNNSRPRKMRRLGCGSVGGCDGRFRIVCRLCRVGLHGAALSPARRV